MKSKKTRERILDASLELFNQKKASNVSTVQISAAMKISPGNLYYYYANKEDVIRCIWEERMSDKLYELMESTEGIKNAADLLDFIQACLKYMIEYRFFYTELSTLFINDEKLVEIYRDAIKNMRDTFSSLVIRLGEEGKFIDYDNAKRALAVQSAVASAIHMLSRYDVYSYRGISDSDFIGYSWIRIISALEPIFKAEMKTEVDAEMSKRGFSKEKYLDIIE